jgi:hypothetical protein
MQGSAFLPLSLPTAFTPNTFQKIALFGNKSLRPQWMGSSPHCANQRFKRTGHFKPSEGLYLGSTYGKRSQGF